MRFVQSYVRPSPAYQRLREGFANEGDQQTEKMRCDRSSSSSSNTHASVSGEMFKSFQVTARATFTLCSEGTSALASTNARRQERCEAVGTSESCQRDP